MGKSIKVGRFSAAFARDLRVFADLIANEPNWDDDGDFLDMVQNAVSHYGITQVELAKQFRVNKATVNKWARGRNAPHVNIRSGIASWIGNKAQEKAAEIEAEAEHANPGRTGN